MKMLLASLLVLAATPVMAIEPTLYGRYEYIGLPQIGTTLKAKMDTGAMSASLSARDIERFKRDGQDWVRFRLAIAGEDQTQYEQPLLRDVEIKVRSGEKGLTQKPVYATRPVVKLDICLGHEQRSVEVNLTDRRHFDYPLLIGAKAIRKLGAAIDPADRYTADQPQC